MKLRLLLPLVVCLTIGGGVLAERRKPKHRTSTADQMSQVLTQVAKDQGENVRVKIQKVDDHVIVQTMPLLFPPMDAAPSDNGDGRKKKKNSSSVRYG